MARDERLRRPDPKRTGPIRNFTTYFRDTDSWGGGPEQQPSGTNGGERPPESLDDAVTHGVKLGYQVIEEQIRQGRRVARKYREGCYDADDLGKDVGEFLARALRIYQDLGTLCFEVVESAARNPSLLKALGRSRRETAAAPAGEPRPGSGTASNPVTMAVEVETRRATRASAELQAAQEPYTPLVRALYAADPAIAPLTGVRFIAQRDGKGVVLRVEVPADQPPATYTGVVVDSESNEPRGTVCIRILD